MNRKRNTIATALLTLTALVALALGLTATARAATAPPSGVVNVNTATQAQLELLPGVGPSKARAILDDRSQHRFKTTGELVKVKGIGAKLLQKVEPHVVVDGQTTIKAPKKKSRRKAKK